MLVAGPLVELDAVMELTPKLDDVPIVEAGDEKGEVLEVEDGMEVVPEPNSGSSVSTSKILFGSRTTLALGPLPSHLLPLLSAHHPVSVLSVEEDSMQTSTLVFDMSVDSMVAEDNHVQGTDMSVDSMVAKDSHVHETDMSVDSMVAEDTHVHETEVTLNNYDHTHMDMMVEDCMQTLTGETSVASPLFSFDSGTQPSFSSYAIHLDWWPAWLAKSNW
nr:hypothetical protein [Tanacetum cinerariifolium]